MQQRQVYHVELKEPLDGEARHQYFGSVKAIFSALPAERLGVTYLSLKNNYNMRTSVYENKRCIIRSGVLITSKGHRGNYDRNKKGE